MTSRQRLALGVMVPAALVLYGWLFFSGGDNSGRIGIAGSVTYNGAALENGRIQFTPQPNTVGPAVSATITDGAYRIRPQDGAFPGTYEATIMVGLPSMDPAERLAEFRKGPSGRKMFGKTNPSVRWPAQKVIAAGEREVVLDFDLPPSSD